MSLIQIIVLALVQGITEFLPISSQAHLVLVPRVTGWCDQGLLVDIAVHVGTLLAVLVYFRRESLGMTLGALNLTRGRQTRDGRLFLLVMLATIPVLIAGYMVKTMLGTSFRSLEVIAWTTIGFAMLLWFADRLGMRVRRIEHMTWGGALFIGLAQVLALIPGTSRSGITMTAARIMGYERVDAARFSLLMAIPVIIAAGTLAGLDLVESGNARLTGDVLLAGGLAFVAAMIAIALMMGWLRRASFTPFVIYRILLGVALLIAIHVYGVADSPLTAACTG